MGRGDFLLLDSGELDGFMDSGELEVRGMERCVRRGGEARVALFRIEKAGALRDAFKHAAVDARDVNKPRPAQARHPGMPVGEECLVDNVEVGQQALVHEAVRLRGPSAIRLDHTLPHLRDLLGRRYDDGLELGGDLGLAR